MTETLARLYRARALIWTLARRELKARYRGSFLGFAWSLLNPLALLVVYSLVFTLVFSQRGAAIHPYALFLFGGVLAWNFLASSLLDASETFRNNGPLLRKIIVDPEVFPGVSVLAQGFHFVLALPVLAAATVAGRLWFGAKLGWPAIQFFPVMLLLAAGVLGMALCVSALSVHFRDIRDLLQNLLTFWFFASPVIYAMEGMPPRFQVWIRRNPATPFFRGIHQSIFYNRWIGWRGWVEMAVLALAALVIGAAVFAKLRDSIAEEA